MKKILGFFLFFPAFCVVGQSAVFVKDSLPVSSDSAVGLYFASMGETLAIHNGRVFYGYPGIIGHAFYPSKDPEKGSVLYDGTWYQDVSMMYDIYKDQLVMLHPSSTFICLFSERVQKFYFGGQTFVRLPPDKNHVIKSGFYQQLTGGDVTIIVNRQKSIEESIVDLTVEKKFISSNSYYALKDGNYYLINNRKSLLNLLKEDRKSILKHLKQEKLIYKQDEEKTIVEIAEFYNQSHK